MLSYRRLLFSSFAILTGDCNQHVVPTSLHSGFHAVCVSAQIALRHKQTGLTQLPTIEKKGEHEKSKSQRHCVIFEKLGQKPVNRTRNGKE